MVVKDNRSDKDHEETQALLKILAMGDKQIEAGQYRLADEVFAALESETQAIPGR